MAQELKIMQDAEGRIVSLAGLFEKQTNSNGSEDHYQPTPVIVTVPKGTIAFISGTLTVDDWGYVDIKTNGQTKRVIDLTSDVEPAGPRGGHPRWTGVIENPIELKEGEHTIIVHQDNAPYSEEYEDVSENNISFCDVNLSLVYGRVNLKTRGEANEWLTAYSPVNYNNMESSTQVYAYVGGELYTLHQNDKKNYENSCALRVSVALSTLGYSLQGDPATGRYNGVSHLRDGYAILRAADMTEYLTRELGSPTYNGIDAYRAEMEGSDIIVMGGQNAKGENHVGIATGADPGMGGGLTNLIWVLNRTSWVDPTR